jgi:predicted Holliday junction resolvase-like endonuclease
MSLTKDIILRQLQTSNLYALCPNCDEEFKLSSAIIFDGLGKFPDIADKKKQENMDELKSRAEELVQRKISMSERSEKGAIATGIGDIIEQILPAYREFKHTIADCRALFKPVDLIIFKGCHNSKVDWITFLDIKTGNARLNDHQRMIKNAIEKQRVNYEVV